MAEKLQYVINEQGEQVAVLLELAEYQRLTGQVTNDPELLVGLSEAELQALADSKLAPATKTHLDELMARHQTGQLPVEEIAELDQLLTQIDQLNILKTRASYTLSQLQVISSVRNRPGSL